MNCTMLRRAAAVVVVGCLVVYASVLHDAPRADAAMPRASTTELHAEICTPFVSVCVDPGSVIDVLLPGVAAAKQAFSALAGFIGEQAAGLVASVFAYMTAGVLAALGSLLGEFDAFLQGSTTAAVTSASFLSPTGTYHKVATIAAVLLIAFLMLGVIQGLFAGEPGQMLARIVRDAPLAVLAIIGIPFIVAQLLDVVDGLCAYVLPTGGTLQRLADIYTLDNFKGLGNGILGIPALLLGVLAFLAALAIYAELVVRAALVYVCVALAPISFAGMVWPAARHAGRKVLELLAAVIASKFVICVALAVGLDLFADHSQSAPWNGVAWGELIVGTAIICLAAFAPWVTWRLMPLAEAAVLAQGLSRAPARAGQSAMQQSFYFRQMNRASRARAAPAGASAAGTSSAGGAAAAAGPIGVAVATTGATVQRARQQLIESASRHVEPAATRVDPPQDDTRPPRGRRNESRPTER